MVNGLATEFVVYQGDQQTEDEFDGVTPYELGRVRPHRVRSDVIPSRHSRRV
jgi:hypothetical protein